MGGRSETLDTETDTRLRADDTVNDTCRYWRTHLQLIRRVIRATIPADTDVASMDTKLL